MHENHDFKVIYEDDVIIVVDKPSGILVIPDFKKQHPTLTDLLNKELIQQGKRIRAHPCHRIDRETSGLVIFSKGKNNQKIIMQQFKEHKVKKRYIAFVQGRLDKKGATIKGYISSSFKHSNRNFRKRPKLAITEYKVLKAGENFSVVEVWPITGRTNQIRIQFKQLGHPLLGERKYAFGKDFKLKFKRLALHASNIEFFHPTTNEKIKLFSNLPKDMLDFIRLKFGALDGIDELLFKKEG
ncbi:MAG: RNA pseudouridine synthase [Candidatus Omnitrophota bacterium]|nr:RNA pseudouridine synthase [Candidatus Omnitrophota bacterium]